VRVGFFKYAFLAWPSSGSTFPCDGELRVAELQMCCENVSVRGTMGSAGEIPDALRRACIARSMFLQQALA